MSCVLILFLFCSPLALAQQLTLDQLVGRQSTNTCLHITETLHSYTSLLDLRNFRNEGISVKNNI